MTKFVSYVQRTGNLRLPISKTFEAYSGFGEGLNNPDKEAAHDLGPIPAGWWRVVRWDDLHAEKGPIVAVLEPVGHDAHGRSAFLCHGDNPKGNHTASHGCIILFNKGRTLWRQLGYEWLLVVHEETDLAGDHHPPVDSPPLVA